ncbi:MAG: 8-oxo-dGTP diphosphatase [Akkermansiaceae bacterium]|jgi:8-oxo-dGTP diphosphatase|nr:8-oxo-dGTP diphosphatase [Akkermansiaceae bacterium]MDP4647581.1 8-oxo-dGTP diphosphatase [Akkermansiaceae bacterium]MDP4720740.1 8-oxo-dGTP diphosphatase [Akkermansiaceae bacterium]MDP4779143.1 8-oxo-dGTP diphosphatase [Akkermansiaceae bacterium]MDP4847232.1 8-oxo-dGTP diphosphatase [Akkermansiaceae bacterium]
MDGFDWTGWQGEVKATLMFVVKAGRILLIEKKRGHGEGKVNGPGGKIDPGETPLECAVRETEEELHISVKNPRKVAELWFQMSDYPSILCHVFIAEEYEGTPTETDEAVPLWTPSDEIPYNRMWEDDRHWLPLVLDGQSLLGKFVFEGEVMASKEITAATYP